jgi:hypothetical protein
MLPAVVKLAISQLPLFNTIGGLGPHSGSLDPKKILDPQMSNPARH